MSSAFEAPRASKPLVLDANVFIAVVRPDLGHVAAEDAAACAAILTAVQKGRLRAYTPAPVVAELIHVLARGGVPQADRSELVQRLRGLRGRLDLVSVDASLAEEAGEYRQTHYHRERLPLSYIDCFCLVLAQHIEGMLVTTDRPLLAAPGVEARAPREGVTS